jgi:hypothetical protein
MYGNNIEAGGWDLVLFHAMRSSCRASAKTGLDGRRSSLIVSMNAIVKDH